MEKHGIDSINERNDLPVVANNLDLVPIRGSVHIANNRIAKRSSVNFQFFLSLFR